MLGVVGLDAHGRHYGGAGGGSGTYNAVTVAGGNGGYAAANLRLLPFRDPPPSRQLALVWRRSSAMHGFLMQLADEFRKLPHRLLEPPEGVGVPARVTSAHAAH